MVGMTSSSVYKLLNVEMFKELISADVTFDEYSTFRVAIMKSGTATVSSKPQEIRPVEGAKKAATESQRPYTQRLVHSTKKSVTERVGSTLGASDQRLLKRIQET